MRYCLDTQEPRGSWQIEPDPRMFDTALVACALSRAGGPASAAVVERACAWLERRAPQDHDPVARLLDEIPWHLLRGSAGPIDLRGPTLYGDLYRRKTILLYALARSRGARVLSPYTPPQIKEARRALLREGRHHADEAVEPRRPPVHLFAPRSPGRQW
ncbi:hypothetical protein [Nannocystis pusilla]|uniref:hypothetical protein n=1 Tax=Nannocystis pusilla TaxID=889268 RepID=UPI003DA36A5A